MNIAITKEFLELNNVRILVTLNDDNLLMLV